MPDAAHHQWRGERAGTLVGPVKVNFLSYYYYTIFGMRGLWHLTINSGRGATLEYL